MPTYTPHVDKLVFEYNAETMVYHIEVPFDLVVNPGESLTGMNNILLTAQVVPTMTTQLDLQTSSPVTGYSTLPGYIPIAASGLNVTGGQWSQWVFCFACARRFEEVGSTGMRKVVVSYEGRVLGVHCISSRVQMATAPIYQSMRPKNWDSTKDCAHQPSPVTDKTASNYGYQGIGADFSGTTRDIPIFIYSVLECVPLYVTTGASATGQYATGCDFYNRITCWDVLAGSVNELGWVPPWSLGTTYAASGGGALEGAYLYLGSSEAQPDKRTKTCMVRHDYAIYSARGNQALYLFQGWTTKIQLDNTQPYFGMLMRDYDPAYTGANIQPTAGSDAEIVSQILSTMQNGTLSAGTVVPKWGDTTVGFNAFGNFAAPMLEG